MARKLSDFKGEQAIEVLADIIEPFATIMADSDIQKLAKEATEKRKSVQPIQYIKIALKNHTHEVLEIMARIHEQPVDEYAETVNVISLPMEILAIVNDEAIKSLFTSHRQTDN